MADYGGFWPFLLVVSYSFHYTGAAAFPYIPALP
jgi:hypothetical protein